MQTRRQRSVVASLVLAAVMVLAAGMAMAVSLAPPHAATAASTGEKEAPQLSSATEAALTAAVHGAVKPTGKVDATLQYSYNWAGYVDDPSSSGQIYEVRAEWSVPTIVKCAEASGTAVEVMWIGIDGWTNGNVSQAGTMSYCSAPGATPAYYDWWEFYPYNDIQVVADSSANAFVSAYILYNPYECVDQKCGVYTLELYDVDNGVNFVVTGGAWVCSSGVCEGGPDANAECISEAPSGFGHPLYTPLAHYKSAKFLGCAATIGSHFSGIGNPGSGVTVDQVDQCNYTACTRDLQVTSGLSTSYYTKDTFSMTWKSYT